MQNFIYCATGDEDPDAAILNNFENNEANSK